MRVLEPVARFYEAVVFAGGGCRCMWQAGFWSVAAPALGLEPRRVGATSAGAAVACALFAGVIDFVIEDFCRRVAENERNAYPANALRGAPIFPHEGIYRETILAALGPDALARLHRGPEIHVLLARPPARLGVRSALLIGMLGYQGERWLRDNVHSAWGRRVGFRSEVVPVSQCRTPEEIADLVLHASCTPPITPLYRRDGDVVLDGSLVDAVPVEAVEPARRTMVLLTRRYPVERLPRVPGRTYVQPSIEIPVRKWDYTSPKLVRQTFDLGRRDGEAFARAAEDEGLPGCELAFSA